MPVLRLLFLRSSMATVLAIRCPVRAVSLAPRHTPRLLTIYDLEMLQVSLIPMRRRALLVTPRAAGQDANDEGEVGAVRRRRVSLSFVSSKPASEGIVQWHQQIDHCCPPNITPTSARPMPANAGKRELSPIWIPRKRKRKELAR